MRWIREPSNRRERKKKLSEINDKLQQELLSWPGVSIHDHRFGGIEF